MSMFYGEGRLSGNFGVYVVEEAQDVWDAERLIRNATVMKEQVHRPKLLKVPEYLEETVWDAISHDPTTTKRRDYLIPLDDRVTFLEFKEIRDIIGRE